MSGKTETCCLHSHVGVFLAGRQPEGARVNGIVVCLHVFGLGVYLPEADAFGHVNVTEMGVESATRFPDDYPQIGARLSMIVLGHSGQQLQLRLRVVR